MKFSTTNSKVLNTASEIKNIDMSPRQLNKDIDMGGTKYRVLGDDSSDFKFKIKNKK